MKRLIPLLLCLVLLLSGCADQHIAKMEVDGVELWVDTQAKTISDGENVYAYTLEKQNGLETEVTIRYPDGVIYRRVFSIEVYVELGDTVVQPEPQDQGTYTGTFDESRYVRGLTLARAAYSAKGMLKEQKETLGKGIGFSIFGLLIAAWGIFMLRQPEDVWHLNHWHSVSGGEPTQFFLDRCYVGGIISIILGGIFVISGVFKLFSLL